MVLQAQRAQLGLCARRVAGEAALDLAQAHGDARGQALARVVRAACLGVGEHAEGSRVDPEEDHDVASEHPVLAAMFRAKISDWKREMRRPFESR